MYIYKILLLSITAISLFTGCEPARTATTETGRVIGETTRVIGGVTDGGAEAVKGKETNEENPFGR